MKKTIALLVVFVALAAVSNYISFRPVARAPQSAYHNGSIVRLVSNGRTFCSGTVISRRHIITAAHCILEDTALGQMVKTTPIEIRGQDNTESKVLAKPYIIRIQLDQAVLTGDFKDFKSRAHTSDIKRLDLDGNSHNTMFSCGYPLGGSLFCSEMQYIKRFGFSWKTDGILLPGMSGGPVIMQDGTVIGVNNAVEDDLSIVTPLYNIDFQLDLGQI